MKMDHFTFCRVQRELGSYCFGVESELEVGFDRL